MTGIAQKVELLNLAYKLAWKYISEDQKRDLPEIARRLRNSIRWQLKEGSVDSDQVSDTACVHYLFQRC